MNEAIKKALKRLIELEYITVNPSVNESILPTYFLEEIEKIPWRLLKRYFD